PRAPRSHPYPTLFRSAVLCSTVPITSRAAQDVLSPKPAGNVRLPKPDASTKKQFHNDNVHAPKKGVTFPRRNTMRRPSLPGSARSEEYTSELQSRENL